MLPSFDTIVLGLGGMGSAAAYHLAKRGVRVLGLDQFDPAHTFGSSHGRSRVVRQAYFEDPRYVPLLLRSYELWRELEADAGLPLLHEVGGLMIGAPDSAVVRGSRHSAETYDLAHEILDAAEIRRRFPAVRPQDHEVALLEKRAGYVLCDDAVSAHLRLAGHFGAELRFQEKVLDWEERGDLVRVRTDRGIHEAGHLVIAPGAWAPEVLARLGLPLVVERQVLYWFQPAEGVDAFLPDRFPVFIWDSGDGATPYGFPSIDGPEGGVKVAYYHAPEVEACSPDRVDRTLRPAEIERMRAALATRIPALAGTFLRGSTCLYTNTPDLHFVIAPHPDCPRVTFAAGFSGHGFKFCPVVGEILADFATKGETSHDIALFDPRRWTTPGGEIDLQRSVSRTT